MEYVVQYYDEQRRLTQLKRRRLLRAWLVLLFTLLIFVPFINAQPFAQIINLGDNGFDITLAAFNYLEQKKPYDFHIHVFNKSNGVSINNSICCSLHLYNKTGNHINVQEDCQASNTFDYEFEIAASNLTTIGRRAFIVQCENATQGLGGFIESSFFVTEDGEDNANLDRTSGLVVFLFLFSITAILIITPIKYPKILSIPAANEAVRRMFWFLGLTMLLFDVTLITQIADKANLQMNDELFMFLDIISYILWPMIVFVLFAFLVASIKAWDQRKLKKRMEEDNER
jgi:hypothetical protein